MTTNLTLNELNNPRDTAHARIYDRLKEMCVPVNFSGESRTLDIHIRTLRQKLGSAGNYIHTVRKVGYQLAYEAGGEG